MATCPESTLIATVPKLRELLAILSKSSALYLDVEGWNLSRYGTVSIITILARSSNQAQLIDVSTLGDLAFNTASEDGKTLRSILEDPSIFKYIWDVRSDANALWFHYGVGLCGITDLQLLENASRSDDKTYVRGLDKCIQYDLRLGFMKTNRWLRTKQDMKKLMCNDVFSIRPLDPKTIEYCQNDIIHLPALHDMYIARVKPEWLAKAKEESQRRVDQARSLENDPQSEGKKLGPWGSGGEKRLLTIEQIFETWEDEQFEALERDAFEYDHDLNSLDDDGDWDQEGAGDYEDWGALHSDWDKNS
ncbi:ribonuclease H-like domain-containing protein [Phaeosphaeria sp. MPI-PUGE-AT-0046c]|nr:ribonuclease H-like domain-containing protein [Phaeosphaeria sp. MPI-PUGE-AT-0046c]